MNAEPTADFTGLPDLASRQLSGSVVCANDELFAERENLIKPGPAVFSAETFGNKGKVYDGWETRRRREPGHDYAIVRLGAPGVVRGVVIDTSWFTGNYPPYASVEATGVAGYPSPAELDAAEWVTIVAKSAITGDGRNPFAVSDERRFTHVRLSIYPDGGVARLRVHGEPMPDPRLMTGTVDLAALEYGGRVVDCSNMFYSSPWQLLLPGRAGVMSDGWENARRRDEGNDWVTVQLASPGRVRRVEIDTSYFVGNAPGWASLRGVDVATGDLELPETWPSLVPRTPLQPDTRHVFRVAEDRPVSHVRVDVYPDGGLARLRVHGEIGRDMLRDLTAQWLDRLPSSQARVVLTQEAGWTADEVGKLLAQRPFDDLPDTVITALLDR
jgi:allantoicase